MTKLRLISDTHYDYGLNANIKFKRLGVQHTGFGHYFGKTLAKEKDCITLIAGDIAASLTQTKAFLEGFFANQQVMFVSGNHKCYDSPHKTIYEVQKELENNFPKTHMFWHYLENDWMWIPGTNESVAIIGSEFYTDYEYRGHIFGPNEDLHEVISTNMSFAYEINDFRYGLETPTRELTPNLYRELHYKAKDAVIKCYNAIIAINPRAKVILMTHHCLSSKCLSNEYNQEGRGRTNASYISELEDWLCDTMPNLRLVISGHVHCGKDFRFGLDNKRYIVNACGYISKNEPFRKDKKFNPNFIIDTEDL